MRSLKELLMVPVMVGLLIPSAKADSSGDDAVKAIFPSKTQKQAIESNYQQQSPLAYWTLNRMPHQVKEGETLESIASIYYGNKFAGAMSYDIGLRNGVLYYDKEGKPMSGIKQGDMLFIGNFIPRIVKAGETYKTIADQQGITEEEAKTRFFWNSTELKAGDVIYMENIILIEPETLGKTKKPTIKSGGGMSVPG